MTRIETTFNTLRAQNKKALIPYVMAGDPNPSVTVSLLHELVDHGADIIEVGLPFSDPMADGETIALAGERAIAAGTSTRQAIDMVREFRKTNTTTPVLVMGYLNPIEIIGIDCATTLQGLQFANSETERFEARETKKDRMGEVVAAKINRYEPKLRPFFIEPKLEPKLSR